MKRQTRLVVSLAFCWICWLSLLRVEVDTQFGFEALFVVRTCLTLAAFWCVACLHSMASDRRDSKTIVGPGRWPPQSPQVPTQKRRKTKEE